MTLIRSSMLVATVLMPAASLRADLYMVDISGTDDSSGHLLRVSGLIDVDVATDVIASSNLTFEHETAAPVSLPSIPFISGDGVDFVETGGMLFITPRAADGYVSWARENSTAIHYLNLFDDVTESSDPTIQLDYASKSGLDNDKVNIDNQGSSVKLGTAVPEASAFVYLSLVGLGVAGATRWRKRRLLNLAIRS